VSVRDAEADRELIYRVALSEGCSQAFIEIRFETLDGTNDGYVR